MGRVTDLAPAGLVPAAWLLTMATHASLAADRTLLIGLGVMDVVLLVFYVVSFAEMTGILRIWQQVLLAGLLATLLGTADMLVQPGTNPVLPVALYAWMLLPGVAYVPTGLETAATPYRQVYLAAAVLTVLGTAVYSIPLLGLAGGSTLTLAGLGVLGAGQTAGIVAAAVHNS